MSAADEERGEKLLALLAERAHALGAGRAAPLAAAAVVVDERVRLKCRVPLCSSYGRNLMCPPNVPSPDETRDALALYRWALVVQQDIPVTQAEVTAELGEGGYIAARALPELPESGGSRAEAAAASLAAPAGYESRVTAAQNSFAGLMTSLETAAFKLGCRFAAAYSGGDCVLCDTCVGQGSGEPCRHPFAARPSMEAVGIDVVATAAAAGLTVELPAIDRPCWTGLLLVE